MYFLDIYYSPVGIAAYEVNIPEGNINTVVSTENASSSKIYSRLKFFKIFLNVGMFTYANHSLA